MVTTLDIIQTLCARYQLMRNLHEISKRESAPSRRTSQRNQLIWSLKQQIWKLKQQYMELRGLPKVRGMLYEYNGRFFLATKEITMAEYREAKRLQSMKVA